MGLTVKSKIAQGLPEEIELFFDLPEEATTKENPSDELKTKIYNLDIDIEEKANIISKINLLETTNNTKEKQNLEKEVESFIKKYNL